MDGRLGPDSERLKYTFSAGTREWKDKLFHCIFFYSFKISLCAYITKNKKDTVE